MQNEILKPVLDSDESAIPRYDIVGPSGNVIQQNVELRLKNEVVQEGTPYDEESVLPASLRERLELPPGATPAEAFNEMIERGGGAVRKNRPPTTSDAETVGKIWIIPEMVFHNQVPDTLQQKASNWQSSNATVSVSGDTATFTGGGAENTIYAQMGLRNAARAGDVLFIRGNLKVNHDANAVAIVLTCGSNTIVSRSLNVPAAGDTVSFQEYITVEEGGALIFRVSASYNTAAVQSGKSVTVSGLDVWNLTSDMCGAQAGIEFTEAEAAAYIDNGGRFQDKVYQYNSWWWVLRSNLNGSYNWVRMHDLASTAEAKAGTSDTVVMTPLKSQQLITDRLASKAEALAGTATGKIITAKTLSDVLEKPRSDIEHLYSKVHLEEVFPQGPYDMYVGQLTDERDAVAVIPAEAPPYDSTLSTLLSKTYAGFSGDYAYVLSDIGSKVVYKIHLRTLTRTTIDMTGLVATGTYDCVIAADQEGIWWFNTSNRQTSSSGTQGYLICTGYNGVEVRRSALLTVGYDDEDTTKYGPYSCVSAKGSIYQTKDALHMFYTFSIGVYWPNSSDPCQSVIFKKTDCTLVYRNSSTYSSYVPTGNYSYDDNYMRCRGGTITDSAYERDLLTLNSRNLSVTLSGTARSVTSVKVYAKLPNGKYLLTCTYSGSTYYCLATRTGDWTYVAEASSTTAWFNTTTYSCIDFATGEILHGATPVVTPGVAPTAIENLVTKNYTKYTFPRFNGVPLYLVKGNVLMTIPLNKYLVQYLEPHKE